MSKPTTESLPIAVAVAAAKSHAIESHKKFEQYVGHWNGAEWQAVRVKRSLTTKMGTAFEAGDITIAKRQMSLPGYLPAPRFATAYSFRNGIDTSIEESSLEWLDVK